MEQHYKPKTLAVKLKLKAEKIIKKGHFWVYSDSILKIAEDAQTGDICVLFDNKDNKLYAVGLYDKNSSIRIKIIQRKATKVDADFFSTKIQEAYIKRQSLLQKQTNSYRLLYGENDFLPAVIADVYADVLVLKLYAAMWFPYLKELKNALISIIRPRAIVLRLSRNTAKETDAKWNGAVIYGELKKEEVTFKEHGVFFSANVVKGHKTGFFLDHRLNRKKVGELAKNKTVLDVFSYAGGFSVHALVGGAKEVTSVDISEQALEMAKKNVERNTFSGKHYTIAQDAFEVLRNFVQKKQAFDIVVIDPPSFAKSKEETAIALKKYAELASLGAKLVQKNGILVLASCSSQVQLPDFLESHNSVFKRLNIHPQLLDVTEHDVDHPVAFAEGAYLKAAYYQF